MELSKYAFAPMKKNEIRVIVNDTDKGVRLVYTGNHNTPEAAAIERTCVKAVIKNNKK